MEIEKAIEILKYIDEAETIMWNDDHYDALRLGIEALIRIGDGRSKGYDYFGHLLPGETGREGHELR